MGVINQLITGGGHIVCMFDVFCGVIHDVQWCTDSGGNLPHPKPTQRMWLPGKDAVQEGVENGWKWVHCGWV